MAAGLVDIPVLDGLGATIAHAKFWSSDGTAAGNLSPVVVVVDSTFAVVDYTAASPVTVNAGTAIIGKVTTDQTTHGTSDLVAADITKIAGAAVPVGHGVAATAMRVELPTDGTGVVGLIAGSAVVGKFGVDQTTPGTTNGIAVNDRTGADALGAVTASPTANTVLGRLKDLLSLIVLGAGANIIGKVGMDQTTPGTTNNVAVGRVEGRGYETVAASATAQVMGGAGATGDDIDGILVIPATTSPGNVLLLDNATSITVFTGGATSVSNLVPFFIPLGMRSVSGAWKITTGANVSCIGIGRFT